MKNSRKNSRIEQIKHDYDEFLKKKEINETIIIPDAVLKIFEDVEKRKNRNLLEKLFYMYSRNLE